MNMRSGGRILVDQLVIHGAELAFCVPGESYLPVLDALSDVQDQIKLITCRHESGASNMAEAYGKLTGTPGICFVTRAPGATHASVGVHTAFSGLDADDPVHRPGRQQIHRARGVSGNRLPADVRPDGQMGRAVDHAERIPEFVARAYQVATSGRMS
jgi:acetolactate synthase-1/2/3 large subunit